MNKILSLILAICILTSCKRTAKISIDETNLRNLKVGDTTAIFTIKNIGNDSLKILDFSVSCGCTGIDLIKNEVIYPNSTRKVNMSFHNEDSIKKVVTIVIKSNTIPSLNSFKVEI